MPLALLTATPAQSPAIAPPSTATHRAPAKPLGIKHSQETQQEATWAGRAIQSETARTALGKCKTLARFCPIPESCESPTQTAAPRGLAAFAWQGESRPKAGFPMNGPLSTHRAGACRVDEPSGSSPARSLCSKCPSTGPQQH